MKAWRPLRSAPHHWRSPVILPAQSNRKISDRGGILYADLHRNRGHAGPGVNRCRSNHHQPRAGPSKASRLSLSVDSPLPGLPSSAGARFVARTAWH
jgi:hypothetical protein